MENTEKSNKKEVTEYEGELEGLLDSINKLKNNDTMPEDKKKEELNNLNSKLEEIRNEIMAKIEEGEYTEEEKKILEDKIKSIEENQKELADLEASIKWEEEWEKEWGKEWKEGWKDSDTTGTSTQQDVAEEKKWFFDWLKERAANWWENAKEFVSKWRNDAKEFVTKHPIWSIAALLWWISIVSWIRNKIKKKKEVKEKDNESKSSSEWGSSSKAESGSESESESTEQTSAPKKKWRERLVDILLTHAENASKSQ